MVFKGRMFRNVNVLKGVNWNTNGSVSVTESNINFSGAGKVTGEPDINYISEEFKIDIRASNQNDYTNKYNPKAFIHVEFKYLNGLTFKGSYPLVGDVVTISPDISEKGDIVSEIDQYPIIGFKVVIESQHPINITTYKLYKSTKDTIEESPEGEGGFSRDENGDYVYDGAVSDKTAQDIINSGSGGEYVRSVPVVLNKFDALDYYPPNNIPQGYVDGYVQSFTHYRRPDFSSPPTKDHPDGEFVDPEITPPWWATDSVYNNITKQTQEVIRYLYANDGRVYVSWGDSEIFYPTSDYSDPFQVVRGYGPNAPNAERWVLVTDAYFSGSVDGEFLYGGGGDQYIEIPHVIKGVNVTSYREMFIYSNLLGVRSSNSNITDMNGAFKGAGGRSLDLSNFNTSSVIDMSNMFRESSPIMLNMSGVDTSQVTNMAAMFHKSKFIDLDLGNFDTSQVVNMANMFNQSEATNINVSSFDTSNVTKMDHMFRGSSILDVDLKNFNTSNVTHMRGMFRSSSALNINIESFEVSKVTDMSYMFENSNVESITLNNFHNSNKVTDMSNMFSKSKATTININNLNTYSVENMSYMFNQSKVNVLDLSNFDTFSVTNTASMFDGCEANEIIFGNLFITAYVSDMSRMFANTKVKILDLSGFSFTHKIKGSDPWLNGMFWGAEVEVIYVRSQADADVVNNLTDPSRTQVIVKP